MNLHADDPKLSAWVLGELCADEAEAVRRAVEGDPVLQAAADELRGVSRLLGETLPAQVLSLQQRQAVFQAGREANFKVMAPPRGKSRQRQWQVVLASAAVVAAGLFLASRIERDTPASLVTGEEDVALQPFPVPRILTVVRPRNEGIDSPAHARLIQGLKESPGPFLKALSEDLASRSLPEASRLPETQPLPPMDPAGEIGLPLLVGRASYDWVRGWIRERNELPPRDAVRLEELANAFPLPAEVETEEFAGLRIACVSMESLWSGPGRLVGVQIANLGDEDRRVSWSFRPESGSGRGGARVLASTGGGESPLASLPAGQRTLVLIEVASAGGDAGDLVVSSGGRSKRFPAVESREPGLKQAALVAAFGIWLRGEGIDDSRLREILASAGEDSDPLRADSRRLVGEALDIAASRR